MNKSFSKFVNNFSYTIISNLISLIISMLVVLIVPKIIGIKGYGYWQLYLFYSSYIGLLHFGWNDGIYLRYGGEDYEKLNKKLFFSQFIMLLVFQILIAIIIYIYTFTVRDKEKGFIIEMISISLILTNVRYFFLFILQATNKIKEYARIIIMDRVLYSFFICLLLLSNYKEFKVLIIADLFAKLLSLIYTVFSCKEIIFVKLRFFKVNFKETIENISVGIKLMMANISSKLILGNVKFGIENAWSIVVFGNVSLTLSISNFLMIFIGAIGLVLFPVLRRVKKEKLSELYLVSRNFLMIILLFLMVCYYPIKIIFMKWLPDYKEGLKYMAILFPMCIYEGKMSLLINTYLKTLREEKFILKINVVVLLFSFVLTYFNTVIIKNLDATVFSIIFLIILRCILSERYLSKILEINVFKDIFLEVFLTIVFILSGWYIDSIIIMYIYGGSYIVYLIIKSKDIKDSIKKSIIFLKEN